MSDKNQILDIKKGDYVLATKWSDGSPYDQWCVGFYHSNDKQVESKDRHMVVDEKGNQFRVSGFRRCEKISKERGEFILSKKEEFESNGRSLWWWKRCKMDFIESELKCNKQQALEELMEVMVKHGITIYLDNNGCIDMDNENEMLVQGADNINPDTLQTELNRMKDDERHT